MIITSINNNVVFGSGGGGDNFVTHFHRLFKIAGSGSSVCSISVKTSIYDYSNSC